MQQFKVVVPDQGRKVLADIPPFGAVVQLDEELASNRVPGNLKIYLYRGVSYALYDDEVEAIASKAPQDVTVEVAGAKATFTGADNKAGYIVGAVVLIVVGGIAAVAKFFPQVFGG